MGKADMTRFDFNALQFIMSEDVERMKDCERGQYITLLCRAWLLGRECSLPNDPELLARWCNAASVSESVMSKFEPREDGRLCNIRLLSEWNEALARSDAGRVLVEERWKKTRNTESASPVLRDVLPKPSQTKPNQAVPSVNTAPVQAELFDPDKTYQEARRAFRNIVGKSIGSLSSRKSEWCGLVKREGHAIVIEAVRSWATEKRDWLKSADHPLLSFLKYAGEYCGDAREKLSESQNPHLVSSNARDRKRLGSEEENADVWIKREYGTEGQKQKVEAEK